MLSDIEISQPLDPSLLVTHHPKSFIICLYKSIPNETMILLKHYGTVVTFGPAYTNVPVSTFPFSYLIMDLRQEDHRSYYQRHVLRYQNQFNIILYRYAFETNNGIAFHNELCEFPSHQVSKEDFDEMLLESPLPAPPNCFLSWLKNLCK